MNKEDQRTLEQVYRSAVSGLYARLRNSYDFLYRKFGNDGLKLIAEMSQEYGISVAQRARTKLAGNDLHSVAEYLLRIFDTVARGRGLISTVERTSDRVVIMIANPARIPAGSGSAKGTSNGVTASGSA